MTIKKFRYYSFLILIVILTVILLFYSENEDNLDEKTSKQSFIKKVKSRNTSESLFPRSDVSDDRIVTQLLYNDAASVSRDFKILIWSGVQSWGGVRPGDGGEVFMREECPLQNCVLESDKTLIHDADLVIFRDRDSPPPASKKTAGQVRILSADWLNHSNTVF